MSRASVASLSFPFSEVAAEAAECSHRVAVATPAASESMALAEVEASAT